MVSVISGAVGGFVATVVMTAVMMAFGDDSPPPTAAFWAQYIGDGEPTDYKPQGMVLHLAYGIVAGAVFVPVFTAFNLGFPITGWFGGLGWGLIWGLALFAGAAGFWMNLVLDVDPGPEQAAFMGVNHLIFGLVLGGWVALGLF